MRRAALGAYCVIAATACFDDPPGGGDEADPTSTSSSDATATTSSSTSGPTTGATVSSSATSGATTDGSATIDGGTGTGSDPDTTQGTAESSATTSSTGGSRDCHTLDFEAEAIACADAELLLPIGPYLVTVTNSALADTGPCVEDVDDEDGETAPLSAHYLQLSISSNSPTTLSFSTPVADLQFAMGPHHAMDAPASTSICTTTAGQCENPTASADVDTAAAVPVAMAGAQDLFIYQTKGVGFIGIDDLEVCFD